MLIYDIKYFVINLFAAFSYLNVYYKIPGYRFWYFGGGVVIFSVWESKF